MDSSDANPARSRSLWGNPKLWLVVLLVCVTCYRFTLIDRGHFFWSDERCYLAADRMVDDLAAGAYQPAVGRLFEAVARPGFVIVSVLPALAQRTIEPWLGIRPNSLASFDIVSAFNVFVALGVTFCVYVLVGRWTRSAWYGLIGAGVYSLLVSSNVWIRHAVPYNESLLFFLIALIVVSQASGSTRRSVGRALLGGVLTAFAYTCYPGHYLFVLINGAVVLATCKPRLAAATSFGAAAAAVIGLFEAVSRAVGMSYVNNMRQLAGTVSMGYTGEGYVFPWRYLRDVEGLVGVAVFVLFVMLVMFFMWRRGADVPRSARVALLAALGTCLLHGAMAVHFKMTVFYGRVFLMFIPFVVVGAVMTLALIGSRRVRLVMTAGLIAVSLASFTAFVDRYTRLVYPADFLNETMVALGRDVVYPANMLWGFVDGEPDDTVEQLDPQVTMITDTLPDGMDVYAILASHSDAQRNGRRIIGVNFKWLFNVKEKETHFAPPPGYRLVAEATHPTAFPATGYEAYKPW
ncbi:MAG: hypothetical protein KJ749_05865, partial [Planctomycetes bacterium]|nr:hypothetical protein [Planctomycetota bacterium]